MRPGTLSLSQTSAPDLKCGPREEGKFRAPARPGDTGEIPRRSQEGVFLLNFLCAPRYRRRGARPAAAPVGEDRDDEDDDRGDGGPRGGPRLRMKGLLATSGLSGDVRGAHE